jgi:hypothetical protein
MLESGNSKRYLELQEVIIPPKKRGPPYVDRDQVVRSKKFAETILSEIGKKASKYPKDVGCPLDLLVYNTHWRFLPSDMVLRLVAYDLRERIHPFDAAHFFKRLGGTEGHIDRLFPNDDMLTACDPARVGAHTYTNVDPAIMTPITNGSTIGARFKLSPETLRRLRGT